ncbi:MAG: DnaJ domain-containing protein [Clostridiales bacterium]|nr:DnaJ domain-containing protein [Clostridiales bacterium]
MRNFTDYYKILQVHHDARQEVIDAAYRCLCKIYHPDINRAYAEYMKMINVAYDTIGNPLRRKAYNLEWRRYNKGIKIDSKPNEDLERKYAQEILDEFFNETINEDWEKTYRKLTDIDKRNIPFEDYVEWKTTVSQLFKLGNYSLSCDNNYYNCEYAGTSYPKILQFTVNITELQIANGTINKEKIKKYVALERNDWKVCLGYTDLKPSIRKYKYLYETLPKIDNEIFMEAASKIDPITGMYSRKGIIEQGEREMERTFRYGNPLSLAVITLKPTSIDRGVKRKDYIDMCLTQVSEIVCMNIRATDIIGRCGDDSIAILLTETSISDADFIISRLLDIIDQSKSLNFDIYWSCTGIVDGNFDQILKETMSKVALKRTTVDRKEQPCPKVGKYKLSDITGFNTRKRNHF